MDLTVDAAPSLSMTDIRTLTEADWRLLRSIRLRALLDAPYAFTSDYRDEVRRDQHWWRGRLRSDAWLIACGEQISAPPTGVISTTREAGIASSGHYINSLWVAPEHRRRRVGKALIQAALDGLCKEGVSAVSLWVLEGNEAARELYRSAGFVHTGERQLAPGSSNRHERRMLKHLRPGGGA